MIGKADNDAVIVGFFDRSFAALQAAAKDTALLQVVAEIAQAIEVSMRAGGKLLIAGNGGSAADAQHIAAELLSRYLQERNPLPAVALIDPAVLTGIGNDFGFEHVFARQVRGLGQRGDVFLALSTSGRSPSVLTALQAGRDAGLVNIGFTGTRGSAMRDLCDLCLVVPSEETAVIQQVYMTAAHAICAHVERELGTTRNT